MFARLVSAQLATNKLDEGMKIWKEQDMPLMESVKGYRGAYIPLLTAKGRGRYLKIRWIKYLLTRLIINTSLIQWNPSCSVLVRRAA